MRPIFFSIVAATMLFAAIPAYSQPSFNCGGDLNPTERTICNTPELAKLDRGMAARFERIYSRLGGDRALAFRRQQTEWRRGRDACGASVACIEANYMYRLDQFAKMNGSTNPPPTASSGLTRSPAATVLADGTIERRAPDGSMVRYLPSGGIERYAADGTKLTGYAYSTQVPHDTLPPLPPPLQNWASGLESSLATILTNILTDEEYSAYQSTETNKADYVLIDWRLRSISILTQP